MNTKLQICIFFVGTQTNCRKKVDEEVKNDREEERREANKEKMN